MTRFFRQSGDTAEYFERQFDVENGLLVYRRLGKGAAYRVSEEQKQEWTRRYVHQRRRVLRALMAATFLIGLAAVALGVVTESDPDDIRVTAALVVPIVLLVAATTPLLLRAATQPARDLAHQTPLAPPLGQSEIQAKFLSRSSYGQFAIAPLIGLLLVWNFSDRIDPMRGWGLMIWMVPASLAALALVQSYRKFRLSGQG